jgi:hypothetical protein
MVAERKIVIYSLYAMAPLIGGGVTLPSGAGLKGTAWESAERWLPSESLELASDALSELVSSALSSDSMSTFSASSVLWVAGGVFVLEASASLCG